MKSDIKWAVFSIVCAVITLDLVIYFPGDPMIDQLVTIGSNVCAVVVCAALLLMVNYRDK